MRIKKAFILSSVIAVGGIGIAAAGYGLLKPPDAAEEYTRPGGFSGIAVNGLTEKPLANAQIAAFLPDGKTVAETAASDKSGKFSLELPDGSYIVTATADGYVSRGKDDAGRPVAIDGGTRYVNAKLRLWPPAKVHGRVAAGRAGISAQVSLRYKKDASGAGDYEYKTVQTDTDGYFAIDGAYAGIASLGISADDFASLDLDNIVLKSGVSLDMGDIPLRDGVSLFGQVIDATSKQPIYRAQITVSRADGTTLATAQTGKDGAYRLIPLDMMQIAVGISADGYHAEQYKMQLKGNANRQLSVALRRAWGMTLNVQNITGRDPIQTHVKITDIATDDVVYSEILANGTHALKSIKGGPFMIEAQSADRLTIVTKRAQAGDTVTLRLKPFARVVAHALNSDESAMTGGQYRFYFRPDGKSSDDAPTPWLSFAASTFEINDLSEGLYRIEIRKAGEERTASTPEFSLHHGDVREISIRMTTGGAIRGHAVSTEGGYNLARATVTLDKDNRKVTTDSDGFFLIDDLPDEPFSLTIKPAREEGDGTVFGGLTVAEDQVAEREFRVSAPRTDERQRRREEMKRRIENGEKPPWERNGFRPPNFRRPGRNSDTAGNDAPPTPPDWDGNGNMPEPPDWGDNGNSPEPPDWDGNGDMPEPPDWSDDGSRPEPADWDGNGSMPDPPDWSAEGSRPEPPDWSAEGNMPEPPSRSEAGNARRQPVRTGGENSRNNAKSRRFSRGSSENAKQAQ